MNRHLHSSFATLLLVVGVFWCQAAAAQPAAAPSPERIAPVLEYIDRTWETLTRSHSDLPAALPDTKIEREAGEPWVGFGWTNAVYLALLKDLD